MLYTRYYTLNVLDTTQIKIYKTHRYTSNLIKISGDIVPNLKKNSNFREYKTI